MHVPAWSAQGDGPEVMWLRSPTEEVMIWQMKHRQLERCQDVIVVEHELEIVWNGRSVVRLACTPQHLAELTCGFLLTSGYLNQSSDIADLRLSETGEHGEVETHPGAITTLFDRPVQSDGCLSRPVPRLRELPVVSSSLRMEPAAISAAMRHLQDGSPLFRETGGAHVAALAHLDGTLAVVREDIGRHNAVDKVAGTTLLSGVSGAALVLSGRISSDIVQKVARMRLPLVISRSAPTQAAVALARKSQLTLIGFARGQRFNVYCHEERIVTMNQR